MEPLEELECLEPLEFLEEPECLEPSDFSLSDLGVEADGATPVYRTELPAASARYWVWPLSSSM